MTSGEEALKSYSFGPKRNLHKFCGKCGSSVFFDPRMLEFGEGDGEMDLLGVNVSLEVLIHYKDGTNNSKVRMFSKIKLEQLDIIHVNNRSLSKEEL